MRMTRILTALLLLGMAGGMAHATWSKVKVTDGAVLRYRLQHCGGDSLSATGVLAPDNGVLHAASTDNGASWQSIFLPKPRFSYDLLDAGSLWIPPDKALVHTHVYPYEASLMPVFHYRPGSTYEAGTINGSTAKPNDRKVWRLLRGDAKGDVLYAVMSEKAQANADASWWLARSGDGGKQWYYIAAYPAIPAAKIWHADTTPGYSQWLVTGTHFVRVDPSGYIKVMNWFPDCNGVLALSAPTDKDVFVLWTNFAAPIEVMVSHSSDGGDTWTHSEAMPNSQLSKWTTTQVSMDFLDASFGVIVANTRVGSTVFYTTDAGMRWQEGDTVYFKTEGGVCVTARGKAVFLGTDNNEGDAPTALWRLEYTCPDARTAPAPVKFVAAGRPVLSYVGNGPYQDAGVSPIRGTSTSQFHFRVRVRPPAGETVNQVWVWLEGPQGAMGNFGLVRESQDGDGEIWGAVYPNTVLKPGATYRYYFTAQVGATLHIR